MKQQFLIFLKRLPLPICGLILGIVSLGNLLYSCDYIFWGNFFDLVGLFFMFLILMKFLFTMQHCLESLKDPIISSVSPTFTMALMVICAFLNRFISHSPFIYLIWLGAILLHFTLIGYFIVVHISPKKFEIEHIYPSWFITFVGLGVIANTATAFNIEIGRITLWLALFFYFLLLPIIFYRIFIYKRFHESTLPLIAILTAPGSLCLSGYLSVMPHPNDLFVVSLFTLSQLLYMLTIIYVLPLLRLPFYPSCAAFTFPLVITATAINLFIKSHFHLQFILIPLSRIEFIIAIFVVNYILIRYAYYLFK